MYSISLIMREILIMGNYNKIQLHTRLNGYYFQNKKREERKKCWQGCGDTGTLMHCCWECKMGQQLQKTRWLVLKKLHLELPYNLAMPILGI